MRLSLLVIFLATIHTFAQAAPWPGVKYEEVRAYAWKPSEDSLAALIKDDFTLVNGAIDPAGIALGPEQVKRLLTARARRWGSLNSKEFGAKCYLPHHLFVFYDGKKRPVAFLEVCLSCLGKRMLPKDPKSNLDYREVARICSELGLPLGTYNSMEEFERAQGKELDEMIPK